MTDCEGGATSSGSEFLVHAGEDGAARVPVRLDDGAVWLTQRLMADLYGKDVRTINEHLRNIYDEGELDHAIRQIVAGAVVSDQVISILSDQFLAEVRGLKQKNLAVELLRRLLNDEVKGRARRNLVEARRFSSASRSRSTRSW